MSRYRVWACELAAQFGTVSNLSVLKNFSDDKDGHVRKAAKKTISVLK